MERLFMATLAAVGALVSAPAPPQIVVPVEQAPYRCGEKHGTTRVELVEVELKYAGARSSYAALR